MSTLLRQGVWPLRTDTFLGGVPFYDLAQLSAFYPFYFTWLPLFKTPFDSIYSIHWIVLLHLLIAQITACIFLRSIGVSRLSAAVGSALFAYSANSFLYAAWLNITAPYAWLPLYLTGIFGILTGKTERRYSLMALGSMVMLVFASPAQPLIHALILTAVFVIFKGIDCREGAGCLKAFRRPVVRIIAIGLLSVLIASPVLLPIWWNLDGMIRWIGGFPAVIGNARIPFAAFKEDQLTYAQLGGVLFKMPRLLVGDPYVGLIPLALAVLAIAWRPRSWLVRAFAATAIYSIVSAAGSNLGLAYVNYYVPILNKIREPSRFLFLFQFSISVLAAVGLDELRKRAAEGTTARQWTCTLVPLVLPIILGILTVTLVRNHVVSRLSPAVSIAALCVLVALTWAAIRAPGRGRALCLGGVWAVTAFVLHAIEVRWIPWPITESQYLVSNTPELDLALKHVAALDPEHDYRVIFEGDIDKQQASMLASYRGIRTLNAYINPAPYRQFTELYHHAPRPDNYFFALGAKFMICDSCNASATRGYRHVEDVGRYAIYQAETVLPHSYLQTAVDGYYSNIDQFGGAVMGHDLQHGVLFLKEGMNLPLAPMGMHNDACERMEMARSVVYERFDSSCPLASVLVLNEFSDPAWNAYIDGKTAEVLKVNFNQMGVLLPPGAHYVEFRYLPMIFKVSLTLMALGFVLSWLYIWRWCGLRRAP
ncbi:hypothetical protein F3J20_04265 [Paraburkholderia sp. Cy-641]|uniref:hypothetical protein n=1 Tax=Paraburkholderia sp. Cy-641 TaxID=2608337 RepID=UPI00141EA920|nr:hypothetical protein [Paraburkholderia sp. Cy-641]NIF76619.1 hypothetical protein [Paraburkholderia sp. Cy-641]